jgi:hypothetical protein
MTARAPLTEAQAEQRREGLRILARIIARHYIRYPQRYAERGDAAGASTSDRDGRLDAGPLGRESEREEAR